MKKCLICDSLIEPFVSFGRMPIANGFLQADQFQEEYFFELAAGFCPECTMVQLIEQPEPQKMFHENYAFYSSTSTRMAAHFQELAGRVKDSYMKSKDPFVVEIGSNDGITLRHFAAAGFRHLGVEPSANVAEAARKKGVQTVCQFFDENVAREILGAHGPADVFLGANVMCHISTLHSVVAGIKLLLKPEGVLIFEDPYLGDIIQKTSYDQIYDEHAFYFSLRSLTFLFERHGMEVIDVMPQDVHGGSMRYTVGRKGAHDIAGSVELLRERENALGLHDPATYHRLRENIERSRDELMNLLGKLKKQGSRVAGYGATSKSTTVINYCGITPELVEFIGDTTPIKQGKFSPGMHIPVRPYADFENNHPNFALLFAWNHVAEIMEKERQFLANGGRWIVYVPRVEIL